MKSPIEATVEHVELAERISERLQSCRAALADELGEAEQGWLAVAEARLRERARAARAELEAGIVLPELKSLRAERQLRLEREWVTALRTLYDALLVELKENSPLIDALFPHRRFEKLDRGGTALHTFRAQFAARRASSYVRRLAADPEYAFVPPLLEPMDRASEALAPFAEAEDLDAERATTLRDAIVVASTALERSLRQARALADAALIDEPERFRALAFDERPRRSARRSLEPTAPSDPA